MDGKNSPPEILWVLKGEELTSRKLVDGEKKQRGGGGGEGHTSRKLVGSERGENSHSDGLWTRGRLRSHL